jgi:hypothetical protein
VERQLGLATTISNIFRDKDKVGTGVWLPRNLQEHGDVRHFYVKKRKCKKLLLRDFQPLWKNNDDQVGCNGESLPAFYVA